MFFSNQSITKLYRSFLVIKKSVISIQNNGNLNHGLILFPSVRRIWFKLQYCTVHTKAFVSGRWTIVKYMPEVRVTTSTKHFGTAHAIRIVLVINDTIRP